MLTDKINNGKMQKALGAVVIIILIGLFGWYVVRDIQPQDSKNGVENTMNDGGIGVDIKTDGGDVVITEIPIDSGTDTITQPELNRTVVMPDRFSPEAVAILQNNIDTVTAQLKEDPNSFQAWSDLANQYKIIDDFEGAIEIWEYLSIVAEGNTVSRINLGEVYHYYLKEYKKSESVFKDIIDINNGITGAYTGLHELYRYSYKIETTLAIDALKEGITAIPDNIDLRMLLASYYTELGMIDEANAVYEEVLVMANAKGNTNLVTIIEAAIQSLE
jgi:tetratricopeptide (TPR) repeat protein